MHVSICTRSLGTGRNASDCNVPLSGRQGANPMLREHLVDRGSQKPQLVQTLELRSVAAWATASGTRTTLPLVSTQPLTEGWSRDAEAAANCARVTQRPIRHDPVAPLALCTILDHN